MATLALSVDRPQKPAYDVTYPGQTAPTETFGSRDPGSLPNYFGKYAGSGLGAFRIPRVVGNLALWFAELGKLRGASPESVQALKNVSGVAMNMSNALSGSRFLELTCTTENQALAKAWSVPSFRNVAEALHWTADVIAMTCFTTFAFTNNQRTLTLGERASFFGDGMAVYETSEDLVIAHKRVIDLDATEARTLAGNDVVADTDRADLLATMQATAKSSRLLALRKVAKEVTGFVAGFFGLVFAVTKVRYISVLAAVTLSTVSNVLALSNSLSKESATHTFTKI